MSLRCDHLTLCSPAVLCLTVVACGSLRHLHKWMCPCSAAWRTVWPLRRTNGGSAVWSRRSWSSVANYKVSVMSHMSCVLLGYFLWKQSHKVSSLPGWQLKCVCSSESTKTVQALQYSSGDGPASSNREVEIRGLKEELEMLRKQIAGNLKH